MLIAKANEKILGDQVGLLLLIHYIHQLKELVLNQVPTRVGQNENYDKLIMEVYTNGSLTPEEAMALSC
jgi:DNA-directed RNA polymerase subunit alpha